MEITCGTDIIEIDRIKKSITERFLKEVYNDSEIEYCEGKKAMKYQHYAARFAAKEAIFKAISTIKIGRPTINFINKKPKELVNIEISISHCKEFAVAMVIAIWKGE